MSAPTALRPPAAPPPARGGRPPSAGRTPDGSRPALSSFARRRAVRTGAWKSTLAVAVSLGVALAGLAPLLQGGAWWLATMSMVVVVLAVGAVLRGRGAPEVVVVSVSAFVWGGLVVLLYAGSTLWFLLPTLSTLTDISGDLAAARQAIAEQEIPADAGGAITQLIVMSVGLIAIVSDELATGLRTPVLSGAGPLAVLAIAPLVNRTDPDVPVYVLAAAAFLLVVWCSSRIGAESGRERPWSHPGRSRVRGGRNPGLAVGIAALAVAAMVALPAVTPGLTAQSLADDSASSPFSSVYGAGIDPTIQLGRDLRRNDPLLSLSYTTSASHGLYLKMVNLSDFSTGIWQPETPQGAESYVGQDFGTPQGLAADVSTAEVTTSISIATLRADWLPLPYPTQRVAGLSTPWVLTPSSLTVTSDQAATQGQNYEVTGLSVEPTAEQLAAAGSVIPDALSGFLSLPADLPAVISDTARQVAGAAATPYDNAVALQQYFRSGQFSYSLNAPDSSSYSGDNTQMIAAFLQDKTGYCVHFSAAMAVMARSLGIPSRIAVGYAPGQGANSVSNGAAVYDVYTNQLHAWPELYFEGIGWLPFEPTPGLDFTPPDYSLPDYAQAGVSGTTGSTRAASTPSADPNAARDPGQSVSGTQTPEQAALGQVRGWGTAAAVLGGIAAIVLLPWMLRALRRRSRVRRIAADERPATLAWTEFEDTLDDHRVQRSAGDTLLDLEQRVHESVTLPAAVVDRLRREVEFEQYAAPGSASAQTRASIRGDLLELLAALSSGASSQRLWLSRLLPVSLLRRRRAAAPTRTLVP
ncbi:DUF3488 and transglutaminase-like domain-containing protein [Herbiconiux sp. 11R-BC]|uniref:transglutaminase family protein n=1 Tax=Herbiconiux sp. 11R-BC TaxID=3111637 RepID=UPI003BFAD34B